ncbi:MAG TPA: hypothetical protein VEU30_17285 [Thermoanaerobaculia bacterium]|nr:hypothetical protein [Thermoanaerobaculia bacterium]
MLTPQLTYIALLLVETLHLLHHRLAKRHISFAEVASSAILCVPLTLAVPAWLYSIAHLGMIAVQIVGSIWIRRLSPVWEPR